eukprot:1618250-Amphidinium_carterae.1
MDCAPIVSSGCSLSVSIDCPADPVGLCAVGNVGLADVDGLGVVGCGGGGGVAFILGCCNGELLVSIQEEPTPVVTPDCASYTTAKPSAT